MLIATALALVSAILVAVEASHALVFVVNDTSDMVDANPGDGLCSTSAETCTLRAAIQEANAFVGSDIIQLPAGTYAITLGSGGVEPPEPPEPDPLAACTFTQADSHQGDHDITCPVTITGAGAGSTIIDASGLDRALEIHPAAGNVTLSGLTVSNGSTFEDGGGIFSASAGTLNLNGVTVTDNISESDGGGLFAMHGTTNVNAGSVIDGNTARNGGGIFNAGELSETGVPSAVTLTDATITGNTAIEGGGGGIYNDHEGALTLTDTEVTENFAEDSGGGLSVVSKSSLTMNGGSIGANMAHGDGGGAFTSAERAIKLTNVTVTGNQAGVPTELEAGEGHGGGLASGGDGSIEIIGSTFSGNITPDEGGGIYLDNNGSVAITDTLVTANEAGAGGGGIENAAMVVTLTRLIITDNVAHLDGGGIESQGSGSFTIIDTSIMGNRAENGGGFANAADGATHLLRTTIYDNAALSGLNDDTGLGGGIYGLGDADATYENVTISGNLAQVRGGGFYVDADADVKVINSTISRNSAPLASGVGGEIGSVNFPIQPSLSVVFKNTIVAGNLLGPACTFAIGSEGGNMEDGDTCMFRGFKDRANVVDPGLDAIADNGGHTMTMALHPDSLAVDGGVGPCPLTDQRGVDRPQNIACDMGAYEFEGPFPPPDGTPPDTEYLTGPIQDTENTSAFTFTGTDDVTATEELLFECRLIETEIGEPPEPPDPTEPPEPEFAFVGCPSPWQVPIIEDGLFTFEVRAIDRSGNVDPTPAVHTFGGVADMTPPQTLLEEVPTDPSGNSVVFTFTATDDQTPVQFIEFECRLDTNEPDAWLECTNPVVFSNLTVGSHTFEVRATDGADNIDPTPATFTWMVGTPFSCDEANITLVADADVFVDQESAFENFVLVPELNVRSGDLGTNARTLIRFPVSNDAPDCALESATLRLYSGSSTPGRTLQAIPLSGPWTEGGATWNSQPGTTGAATTTTSGVGYREWDVTSHVAAMLAGSLTNNGWLIRDAAEDDLEGASQSFLSKETPQDPPPVTLPQLVLRFEPSNDPAPPPPTPGGLATVVCGQVITESIVIQNDLLGCMGEGLIIGAPDIVVDLNGHSISSGIVLDPGEEDGLLAGIRNAGHDNVVIKNGTVRNYGYGVRIMGNTIHNVVEGMTFDHNVIAGVQLFDADNGRTGNIIRGNTFIANGEGAVALVSGSENSVVTGNTFIGNGGVAVLIQDSHGHLVENNSISGLIQDPLIDSDGGIFLDSATDNQILGNTVGDAGDAGIFLFSGSHDNVIQGNTVFRSSDSGISVNDSDGVSIVDNVSHLTGGAGISLGNSHDANITGNDARFNPGGVELGGSNDNLVEGNNVSQSQGNGITVEGGLGNVIRGNTADNTNATGIAIEAEAVDTLGNPIPGNVIEGNSASGNLGDGISVSAGGHVVSDNQAHNNAGFGIVAGEFVVDGGGNTASGNGEPLQCVGVVCTPGSAPPPSGADLTAPDTVIMSGPASGGSTLDSQIFTFTGTDAIAPPTALRFECRLDAPPDPPGEPPEPPEPGDPPEPVEPVDTENWHECGSPWMYELLLAGDHKFEVRAIDPADNVDLSPAVYEWTLIQSPAGPDSTPPSTTIFEAPSDPSTSTTATFEFRGSDNSTPGPSLEFECSLDGAGFELCTSPVTYTGLGLGSHTFEVRAIDLQGNPDPSPASHTWMIEEPPADVTAPETSIDSHPDPTTVATSANFTFSSNEVGVTFECSLDGADFTTCSSPEELIGLGEGNHIFEVRATDVAGNIGPPVGFSWTVTPAPVSMSVSCGELITESVLVTNNLVNCPGDGLVIGAHGITVDLSGHTIDGVGQSLTTGIRNEGFDSVTITNGIVQEYEVGVHLGAGTAFGIVDGLTTQLNTLAGIHLSNADSGGSGNTVRNNTVAGNDGGILIVNGTQNALVHDNVVSGSAGFGIHVLNSNGSTLEGNLISGSSDVALLLEAADGNTLVGNEVLGGGDSGILLHVGSNGNRIEANTVVESESGVIVLDSNENEVVDNIAHSNGDAGVILENAHDSVVTGNDVRFNSGGIELMGSSNNLIEGNDASQSDGAGISLGDTSLSNTIRLNAANGNASEGIYIGDFAPGGSGNLIDRNTASSNTADGIHIGDVGHIIVGNVADNNGGWGIYSALGTTAGINIDGGGNTASGNVGGGIDPLTLQVIQCFNIVCDGGEPLPGDQIPPETSITSAPSDPSAFTTATFGFTGTDNATPVSFECSLDAAAFDECTSPVTYTGLAIDTHSFQVRALDFSGNPDPTPASYTWVVEAPAPGVPPETTIESGPDPTTVSTSATFTLSSDEPGVTFECSLDGGPFVTCTSPQTYTGLGVGSHAFAARAVDGENLTGPTDTYAWTITAAPVATTVSCGQLLTQSTLVSNDLTDCSGPGLVIGANAITVDLDGHVIDGLGQGVGILNNGFDSVTITNGTVQEFDIGVQLNPGATFNILTDLTVQSNELAGVELNDADNNTVRANVATLNGIGIHLTGGTQNALIVDNTVSNNSTGGIVLAGANSNTVTGNSLSGNDDGGVIVGVDGLPANGNLVSGNTITTSGGAGITIVASTDNDVVGNTVSQSNGAGVSLELADGNTVTGNDVRFNPGGIELSDSSGNLIQSNNAGASSGTGITLEGLSFDNSIIGNTSSGNSGEGIAVDGVASAGQGNLIDGNTTSSNSGGGISVSGSGHTVSNNTGNLNDGWGIFVEPGNVDGGGNSATGNAEPTQCFGVVCTSGPAPGAPDTEIVDRPTDPSNSRNALFTFIGTDDTTPLVDLGFECRLDSSSDAAWVECENPQEYLALAPGTHTFDVRAVDLQDNVDPTPASYTWTYVALPSGVAPDTSIDFAPPLQTFLFEGIFTFSSNEPDVTFECSLDGAAFSPCEFAFEFELEETQVGPHTFQVRATDFEGNTDPTPATYTWTIMGVIATVTDGPAFIAPEDPLEPAEGGETAETTATLVFEANVADATFECSLDLGPFTPCTSPVTYTGLAVGEHLFRVMASDPETEQTQVEPTEYGWVVILPVDTTAPNTTLTVVPASGSGDTFFEFTGTDDQTQPLALEFECRLDSVLETDWFGCLSPFNLLSEFPEFAPGEHTFEVRAIDQGEPLPSVDPTPAIHTWTSVADAVAPETTFLTMPPATTDQIDVEFTFEGSDNATPLELLVFECSVDNAPFEPCDSPESVQGLTPGQHEFAVRAVDLAGNQGAPATHTWTLVNTPLGNNVTVETLMPSGLPATVTFTTVTAFGDTTVSAAGAEILPGGFEVGNALFIDIATTATFIGQVDVCLGYDPSDFADAANVKLLHFVGGVASDVTVSNDPVEGVVCGVVTSLSPFAIAETSEPVGPDTTPPETTIDSGPPATTTATSATFTFSSNEPGSTFECAIDAGSFESCFSPILLFDLSSGEHTLQVAATDPSGNVDSTPATYVWTVDGPPTSEITLGPNEVTESTTAMFAFQSSDPGSEFDCWLDGMITPCTSPVTYTGLAIGEHIFAVLATDPTGNIQLEWEDYEFEILAPAAPTTSFAAGGTPPGSTTETTASFIFTGTDNATDPAALEFECSLDGEPFTPCTSLVELTGLSVDTHDFRVAAVDEIGMVDPTPATFTWTVTEPPVPDTTPPQTTIVSAPAAVTTLTDAIFTFSSSEAGSTFACSLDGEPLGDCVSPVIKSGLAVGAHTFAVQATDQAGNTDPTPVVHAWTIEADVTAPDTTITFGPTGNNAAIDVTFQFTGTDDTTAGLDLEFECSMDGEAFGDCDSPHLIQGLTLGAHTFEVRAVDAAGNIDASPASRSWTTVDATAPDTSIDSGPADPTAASTATFTFSSSEPGSSFECSLDATSFTICVSPHEITGLEGGLHDFRVRAVDPSGNTDSSPDEFEWTVLLPDPPETSILAGPAISTESTTATFLFASDPGVIEFECSLDGAAFVDCESPHEIDGLAIGNHELEVRAIDAGGVTDPTPATHSWTILAPTPPETTIVLAPPVSTQSTSATFTFESSEPGSEFECSLDSASFTSCESPVEHQNLAFGAHTFAVRAIDATGNVDPTPATHGWTIAAPPPSCGSTITLTADADAWVDQGSPSDNKGTDSILKVMSKSGSNLRGFVRFPLPAIPSGCVVDSATLTLWAASSAPGRTIQAIALSGSWNENTVTWSNQPGTTGPAATASSGTGNRSWNVAAQVQSMYDSGLLHGFLIRDAVEGQDHEQQFHAREKGESPPRLVVTFAPAPAPDTTPPETSTPIGGPDNTTTETGATFDLGGTDDVSHGYELGYECSLDGSVFAPCSTPVSYTGLTVGEHTFSVRAVDGAGNVDPTPETHTWVIEAAPAPPADTTAPDTSISSGPESSTTETTATFALSSNESGSTFECALDGGGFAACVSPWTVDNLAASSHTVAVRSIDAAGNLDETPATYAWSVEAVPTCPAATVKVGAVADSWVLQDSAQSNYGTDSVLKVAGKTNTNARLMVQFSMPAIPEGCQIQSATLRLYAGSHKNGRTLQAYQVSGAWSESSVTWGNQPATTGPAATTSSGSGWRTWNVIDQVKGMYAGANRGFLVKDAAESGGGSEQGFHSREKGSDRPPELIVVFG